MGFAAPVGWLARKGWVVAILMAAAPSVADDWPQWLGPKRDGSVTEKIAPWTEETAPKVVWRCDVANGFSAPTVAGGRVFVHARGKDSDKEEEDVLAFDALTGKPLWTTTYARPRFVSVLGTGPRAAPTVVGKRLFTMGINGLLTCLDAETGHQIWQVDLYDRFKADLPPFAVCCAPLVIGNRVIVSVGGKEKCVVALHAETGETVWQVLDDDASTSSPVLFTGGDRQRGTAPDIVLMTPLRLMGLDPIDGTLRWEHSMVFQPSGTSPTPLAFRDRIVASTQSHGTVAVQVKKQEDETLSATPTWQVPDAKSYFSSGIVSDKMLVLVTNVIEVLPSASLTCLDGETGKQLWSKSGVGYFHAGIVRTGDNKLLVLSDSGRLMLFDFDEKGINELCRASACSGTLVSPVISNGHLYVRDGKEIICYEFAK